MKFFVIFLGLIATATEKKQYEVLAQKKNDEKIFFK